MQAASIRWEQAADIRWERERQRAAGAGLLTTAQAARRMGVPVHLVKSWGRRGLITDHGGGGKGRPSLWDYKELRTAPECGRPRGSARNPTWDAENTLRRGGALHPPAKLPYRVLAKSCPECGDLRTTPDHLLHRTAGRLPPCLKCKNMRVARSRKRRLETDLEFRREGYKRGARNRKRANDALADVAQNNGRQWTGPELEIAARDDLSARQVAAMLGRTLYAVKHVRRALQVDPRKINLAAVSPDSSARVGVARR